jgi:preprotein translocase subunit SecA
MLPCQQYRRTAFKVPKELPTGIDGTVDRLTGIWHRNTGILGRLQRDAERADRMADTFRHVSDRRLRERLAELRDACRRQLPRTRRRILVEALAAIREAADRHLGLRPYVVQLVGTLALDSGYLAEMATGEGKTLSAALAAVLAGWTRRPCHVITTNDYLAQRDADTMGGLYRFCGLTVGVVTSPMGPAERRRGYDADVTYTTSKEIVADFLRDRLHLGPLDQPERRLVRRLLHPRQTVEDALVMRGLYTAIVDEVDSVLIDEAVTPLIISREQQNLPLRDACVTAAKIARELEPGRHYRCNLRYKEIEFLPPAHDAIAARCAMLPGIWQGRSRREELVKQALSAREFFHRDTQYVVEEDSVIIVDEFTGRMMPGRTWREGLHQAVEAKEGLAPSFPSETLSRLSFQRFFRLFTRLSGMTGTASEAAAEFWRIYHLPVVRIPTNRPCIRRVDPMRVFPDQHGKWNAVVDVIRDLHAQGIPVLVGTRSVLASEKLALRLEQIELPYNLLNATRHREEAQIVAEAGQPGKITIATNMAGRGTDIKLGRGVAEQGGLRVIATERHEAGRIDRQLYGRCARQGDPGTVHVFASTEDELLKRFLPRPVQRLVAAAVHQKHPGCQQLAAAAFRRAQGAAQRLAFHQRQNLLRMDTWLDEALSFTGANRYR